MYNVLAFQLKNHNSFSRVIVNHRISITNFDHYINKYISVSKIQNIRHVLVH
jgi:hypothetical protein